MLLVLRATETPFAQQPSTVRAWVYSARAAQLALNNRANNKGNLCADQHNDWIAAFALAISAYDSTPRCKAENFAHHCAKLASSCQSFCND